MYLWKVCVVLLPSICALLLEPNSQQNSKGGKSVSGNHYLPMSRFLDSQKQQQLKHEQHHLDIETLRKTMDETFSILTSQLQRKLADIEQQLKSDSEQNETCQADNEVEKKRLDLEHNYATVLLEQKITKDENMKLKNQICLILKNELCHTDDRVKNAEQFENIPQDLQKVKQQILTINSQIATLSRNQCARNEDFLALYSQTSVDFIQAANRLHNLKNFENVSLTNTQNIENRLQHLEAYRNMSFMKSTRLNTKTEALQTQITNNERKVAITACQAGNQHKESRYIVKFGKVKTSLGISDISSFLISGKFICEYEGLYIVSVSLTAYNTAIHYGIYLNGNEYTAVFENDNKVTHQRGTLLWL